MKQYDEEFSDKIFYQRIGKTRLYRIDYFDTRPFFIDKTG